jgi:hypothetical protein
MKKTNTGRLLKHLDAIAQAEKDMNKEILHYIDRVRARNIWLKDIPDDIEFHYPSELIEEHLVYFKRCYKWNLSPYKALTFFPDYLSYEDKNEWLYGYKKLN